MPYNSNTVRSEIAPLIPENVITEILDAAEEQSVVLQLARRMQDMPSQVTRMPVLDTLPVAYFVGNKGDGDVSAAGLKQTTEMAWANKYIYAEELAVVIPIAENVLDDSAYDVWAQIMPHLTAAFGRAIDAAILFGTNVPASWPALLAGAVSAGQTVDLSNAVAGGSDLYDTLLGEGGVWSLVEEDGYDVTGAVGALSMRAKLRGARNTDGNPIFRSVNPSEGMQMYEIEGTPFLFPKNGAFDASQALLFAGQWDQLVYAFRKDLTITIAKEAIIQDGSGNIIFNLFQQDMVALRAVMRLGFALPNPPKIVNQNNATRYPFSVLVP